MCPLHSTEVDGTENLSYGTAEKGWKQHLLENLHLEVIRKLARIFEDSP